MSTLELEGWERLRHGGLLLDAQRQREVASHAPEPLPSFYERDLRKQASAKASAFPYTSRGLKFPAESLAGRGISV